MSRTIRNAPEYERLPSTAHQTRKSITVVLVFTTLAMLLAACGINSLPPGASPVEAGDGNFLLEYTPADATVIITGDGMAPIRVDQPEVDGNVAKWEYRLEPGHYTLVMTRSGYQRHERAFDIDEQEDSAESRLELPRIVLEEKPDSGGGDNVIVPGDYSLRGDPNFDRANLSSEQRLWYDRFWMAIDHDNPDPDVDQMASGDNLYDYARSLHRHVQTLLVMFRATGDLAILDEIDRIAELMRDELHDSWRDVAEGSTSGGEDGYVNWVYRRHDNELTGRDTHEMEEIFTHALVASIAYALEVNRDLDQRYAEHADFWKWYLFEQFEPKWQERNGSSIPYLQKSLQHAFISNVKLHYYLYELSGKQAYLEAAKDMADIMWEQEYREAETGEGIAYVWPHGVTALRDSQFYLQSNVYSRYTLADALELHMAGFDRWASDESIARFAATIKHFVVSDDRSGDEWFSVDIGGGEARAGIPTNWTERLWTDRYNQSGYALLSAWDRSGAVADISVESLDYEGELGKPRAVQVPAGLFLYHYLN